MNPTDRLLVIGFLLFMAYVLYVPAVLRWWAARRATREADRAWRAGLAQAVTDHERRVGEIERAAKDIEETRLMPGYDQRDPGDEDQVPEGLGVVRPYPLAEQFPKLTVMQLAAVARRRAQEHHA